jgi:hypothetical protein
VVSVNYDDLIGEVARRLLGEPNKNFSTNTELRFGSNGSISVDLVKQVWFDHENNEGGGVLKLIKRSTGPDAVAWMQKEGVVATSRPRRPADPARSLGERVRSAMRRLCVAPPGLRANAHSRTVDDA